MGNYKRYITGGYKDKNGNQVYTTSLQEVKRPCKQCGKNDRRDHSSYCQQCSDIEKNYKQGQERLRRKVEAQAKN